MSDRTQAPQQGPRPQERGFLLAALGMVLICIGLVAEVPLSNLPVILIGALLIILHEFHARIHGKIGLSKFHASVVSERTMVESQDPPAPTDLESRRQAKSAGLHSVSEPEWNLPTKRQGYR